MACNTTTLKTFAQETRLKLLSLISTKLEFVLTQDTAELRGYETLLANLRSQIASRGKDAVIEEVAYTWFNRVMALRFMDANGYNTPMVVTPAQGQQRPEILQEAMAGSVDEDLRLPQEDLLLPEAKLYKRLLVAICNNLGGSMPFLFEHISDYSELLLPDDLLSKQSFVTDIRNGMTDEDCQNVEVMGWLYQFYITDRKADAEKKKSSRGGLKSDEQAAATQLFTPHWIVRYMVENSLGRIWMTLHPESRLIEDMPYYIPTPDGQVDTIPEDIKSASDIKFIDPCMGSGHVLVYAFDLFCKMYEEEGYQTREIPSLILTNNIFGIDIDPRCKQLAALALTMKARAYHSRYLRKAVMPNTIALEAIEHDVIESTGAWGAKSSMWQFENADTIGSLLKIDPTECARIRVDSGLFGERQQILKTQAEYLSQKYHCVVTNPPYLGKGLGDDLKNYIQKHYPNSKADTMATFMERCLEFCLTNGKVAMINMQSWMFLSSYENLRIDLLKRYNIDSLLHLGPHAFDEISGEKVQCTAFTIANHVPSNDGGIYYRLVDGKNSDEKETAYLKRENGFKNIIQSNFEKIPGCPIGYWVSNNLINCFGNKAIKEDTISDGQNITANNNKYLRLFWEVDKNDISSGKKWKAYAKGGSFRKWFGNMEYIIDWSEEAREFYHKNSSARIIPEYLWNREGITWTLLSGNNTGFRLLPLGATFDKTGSSIFCKNDEEIPYIMGLLNTKLSKLFLNVFSSTLAFQINEIQRIPLVKHPLKGNIVPENISISKFDWDAHETSWDFQENELTRLVKKHTLETGEGSCSIEAAMKEYQAEWEDKFNQLHANEEELNRQFIEIYGLQDELTPDVPLEEVTILQKGEKDIVDGKIVWNEGAVIKQLISYLVGCFMGRYSIDKPGLIIASQNQDLRSLGLKVEGIDNGSTGRIEIDDDGVVPILAGEYFPDDMTVRIEQAIKLIFSEEHFQTNLRYIDEKLGKPLREYLFKDFFNDHIDGKMYQKRPIYWLFSSKMGDKKKKGYFKALAYMHRMESDTLSKLHADYVVPYLAKIEQQHLEAEDLAYRDDLTSAQRNKARKEAEELACQIKEVKEFERELVQMASQRLSFDLDDGVCTNYPKFYPLVEPIKGLENSDE